MSDAPVRGVRSRLSDQPAESLEHAGLPVEEASHGTKLADLRSRIQDGSYRINSQELATKLMNHLRDESPEHRMTPKRK